MGLLHQRGALGGLLADRQQADPGLGDAVALPGEHRAHLGELHAATRRCTRRWRRRRAAPWACRPGHGDRGGDGRAVHALDPAHAQQGGAHGGAGVAGARPWPRPCRRGPPRRPARARSPSCVRTLGAGIGVHGDHLGRGEDLEVAGQRLEHLGPADEHDGHAELRHGPVGAGDDLVGRLVAAHRVERDGQQCDRSARPGSVDLDGLAAGVPAAVAAHDVGQLGGAAAGAEAARRALERPGARPGGSGSWPWRSSSWGRPWEWSSGGECESGARRGGAQPGDGSGTASDPVEPGPAGPSVLGSSCRSSRAAQRGSRRPASLGLRRPGRRPADDGRERLGGRARAVVAAQRGQREGQQDGVADERARGRCRRRRAGRSRPASGGGSKTSLTSIARPADDLVEAAAALPVHGAVDRAADRDRRPRWPRAPPSTRDLGALGDARGGDGQVRDDRGRPRPSRWVPGRRRSSVTPISRGERGHRELSPSSWSKTAGARRPDPGRPAAVADGRAPRRWPSEPWSLARPAPTIFMVRSSTISKLASFWSQKSSHSWRRRRASASAMSTILRARASVALTTSVRCTMRSARARAWSRISSPSRRTLARYSSRSLQQPAGGPQLVGQALDGLVEEVEHLVAVDHHRGRQRHRPGRRHQVVQPAEQVLDVGAGQARAARARGGCSVALEVVARR